jgi:hypothetical protein
MFKECILQYMLLPVGIVKLIYFKICFLSCKVFFGSDIRPIVCERNIKYHGICDEQLFYLLLNTSVFFYL